MVIMLLLGFYVTHTTHYAKWLVVLEDSRFKPPQAVYSPANGYTFGLSLGLAIIEYHIPMVLSLQILSKIQFIDLSMSSVDPSNFVLEQFNCLFYLIRHNQFQQIVNIAPINDDYVMLSYLLHRNWSLFICKHHCSKPFSRIFLKTF